MSKDFFTEQAEQSQVKTAIVAKYFVAWAKIISGYLHNKSDQRILYLDLFAGPGRYQDGAKSTPLFILEQIIADPILCQRVVTQFNDKDPANTSSLIAEIMQLPGIERLKYKPEIYTEEIGEAIVKKFEEVKNIPTLFFVDPWGYKGLSLRLINSILKDWACECIFFFNYGRINPGLSNPFVKEHLDALFGAARGQLLRDRLGPLDPHERELTIVEEMCNALTEMGGKYTLPFGFKNASGSRTKHHLIFVSKSSLGYKIMKEVMAKESTGSEQGVPTFEYSPASKRQPLLFELARPLDDLADLLLEEYAGKTMTMKAVFETHNFGRRYIEKNYKDALTMLEIAGKIQGNPSHDKRRKVKGEVTCADHIKFTFPNRKLS